MTIRLSTIVPTHNTRELTLRCVASVLAQSAPDRELLVIDDGGTDGTERALAERYPNVRLLRNETALGFTHAANLGLQAAHGALLLLLNSDTEISPGALAGIEAAFTADPNLGVAGAALHYPDGRPQWSGGRTPTASWFFALASGLGSGMHLLPGYSRMRTRRPGALVSWVTGAAMAIRHEVWLAVGPFDERFAFYAQDLDLCLLATAAGWAVRILDDVHVLHHHGASVSSSPGAVARANPILLWSDLLRWAAKHGGERFRARAARALRSGARFRLLSLAIRSPLALPESKLVLAAETAAYRAALAEISRPPDGHAG